MGARTEETAWQATTTDAEARWFIENLATIKVTGDRTGGRFSLVEMVGRGGEMPPLHVHHVDDETFLVLEGELTLFVGDRVVRASAGSTVVAPKAVPHAYRIESEEARWLVISSPAAFAEFVAEASVPAETPTLPPGPPALAPAELAAVAAKHGIEILGPPGTLPA
jgi:quercetin dioxygenase-like cupin family protein